MVVAFELQEKDFFEMSLSEARDTTDAGIMLEIELRRQGV
jgi:hypothetical protein